MSIEIPQPWNSFLRDIDQLLATPTEFHCIGGFVVTTFYGFERETADLDVLEIRPSGGTEIVLAQAQRGSELHKKHRVYLDRVTVIQAYPENYETRLTEMYVGAFSQLRLFAVEAHDLALMKLERNIERDRVDVKYLAEAGRITAEELELRYQTEMRPYIAIPQQRADLTVKLWVEMIRELQQ